MAPWPQEANARLADYKASVRSEKSLDACVGAEPGGEYCRDVRDECIKLVALGVDETEEGATDDLRSNQHALTVQPRLAACY